MDLMIDLETFGLGPTSAIVEVGAVEFDRNTGTLGANFRRAVCLQSSLMAGMDVDAMTIAWWRKQRLEAKENLYVDTSPLTQVLGELESWFGQLGNKDEIKVWAQGAAFDFPILEYAYKRVGCLGTPWAYRNVRDTRTVFDLAETAGWAPAPVHKPHCAIDDCIEQIRRLVSALRFLNN